MRRFAEDGFHATSMADVIAESGMSAGGVYGYFRGKEDLIEAIIDHILERMMDRLARVEPTEPGAVTIDALLDATEQIFVERDDATSRLVPQMWTEALRRPSVGDRTRDAYRSIVQRLASRVDPSHATGDAIGIAHVWLALMQGYTLQRLILGNDFDAAAFRTAARRLAATTPTAGGRDQPPAPWYPSDT